jgi:hypothetical protein
MEGISEELLLYIFYQLVVTSPYPMRDLVNCYKSCRSWQRICADGVLWEYLSKREFPISTKIVEGDQMMMQFKNLVKVRKSWRKEPKKVMLGKLQKNST